MRRPSHAGLAERRFQREVMITGSALHVGSGADRTSSRRGRRPEHLVRVVASALITVSVRLAYFVTNRGVCLVQAEQSR
jgi:hypothetical protein